MAVPPPCCYGSSVNFSIRHDNSTSISAISSSSRTIRRTFRAESDRSRGSVLLTMKAVLDERASRSTYYYFTIFGALLLAPERMTVFYSHATSVKRDNVLVVAGGRGGLVS